jgi:hypothetical protein
MNIDLIKFNSLSLSEKKTANDFLDFLSNKKKPVKQSLADYKKKILSVSTWSEDDLKIFEELHLC